MSNLSVIIMLQWSHHGNHQRCSRCSSDDHRSVDCSTVPYLNPKDRSNSREGCVEGICIGKVECFA